MDHTDKCGIVYIATGKMYVQEARYSAKSAKRVMPDTPITLITDKETNSTVFDTVIEIDNPRYDFGDQVCYLGQTPYERTIFLDSDIYLDESIEDLFDVLDKFDIAVARNQTNHSSEQVNSKEVGKIPDCFPEYNTGVVAFESNTRVNKFLEAWKNTYVEMVEQEQTHNQAAFRLALYNSAIRIATLPSEYNCVFRRPGCVTNHVKVFHGRLLDIDGPGASKSAEIEQAISELNRRTGLRLYYYVGGRIKLVNSNVVKRFWYSMLERGILGTVKRIPPFLKQKANNNLNIIR